MGESNFDIDSVYRYLIPDHEKSRMREVGVKGGISFDVSIDYHPRAARLETGSSI